jgi:hypothetical protein
VASFDNVFTHQTDDGFITVDMRLRTEENRETQGRYENQ